MIKNFNDLHISSEDSIEAVCNKLKDKLGIEIVTMKELLGLALKNKSEDLVSNLNSITPYGDYSKYLEDQESMVKFLKEEASNTENWHLKFFMENDVNSSLLQFVFFNSAVDEGETLEGHVFVGKNGKIKHSFVQVN